MHVRVRVCVYICICTIYKLSTTKQLSFMFSTDLDGCRGDPDARRPFLRGNCPDVSHRHHFGKMTSLVHSRLRRSTPFGWHDSRTWHRIGPLTDTRRSLPRKRRLWRCSNRNWCCRSCRRRRCWSHSRRRQNTSRRRRHTASCLRSFFGRKAPL